MHVHGTSYRLFVNSTLGCRSKCSYCYLPALNYEINASHLSILDSTILAEMVESNPEFRPGKSGSIISLGCYSECWDEATREATLQLIEFFLRRGNPVQFATKRFVSSEQLERITPYISWQGQLCVFISSTSLSRWHTLERGTDSPETRFSSFNLIKDIGVPTYLYIKPVIRAITINDLNDYLAVAKRYDISGTIVGRRFVKTKEASQNESAPIGDGELEYLHSDAVEEEIKLFESFSAQGNTYSQSIEAIEFWRNNA
jgi:DNA repair photolyase